MQQGDIEDRMDARIVLDHAVQFTALMGGIIPARAKKLSLNWKDDKPQFSLVFEVEIENYHKILAEEGFGLYSPIRDADADLVFEALQPIELRAMLRQPLSDALIARGEEIEDLLKYLLQSEQFAGMPVKSSESWLALEVKQLVDLPNELEESGTLKKGYRTAWTDILTPRTLATSKASSLNDVIEGFFSAAEWAYEKLDESLLRLAVHGEQGDWVTLVQTDEEDQRCVVYSVYPDLVPESRREAMAAILIQENYEIPIGNFEMDLTDGEVRFRTSIEVVEGQMTSEWFERMFMVNISMTDGYFALISDEIKATK